MNGSIELFMKQYRAKTGRGGSEVPIETKFSVIDNILSSLEK
jgi:hypothetical protein